MRQYRVVQTGKGVSRPLVVVYHLTAGLDSVLTNAVHPNTAILNFTGAPFSKAYRRYSSGMKPFLQLFVWARDRLKCEDFSPVVIVGFSEGCGAIYTKLLSPMSDGYIPRGVIAVDGIHSSRPLNPFEWNAWTGLCTLCGTVWADGMPSQSPIHGGMGQLLHGSKWDPLKPVFEASCSQITPPNFSGVREVLEKVTGWDLSPGTYDSPHIIDSGNVSMWSFPGTDKVAHQFQAKQALPRLLRDCAIRLGFAPEDTPPGWETTSGETGIAGPSTGPPPDRAPPVTRMTGPQWKTRFGVAAGTVALAELARRLLG